MAVTFIGKLNTPNYTALSTDIALDGTLPKAYIIGATVLLTDTNIWKVVKDDLTLADYALPISFNGSVDIGAVHIDQQLSESVELAPYYDTKSVTVPGTAEALSLTDIYFVSMTVMPKPTNGSPVYFGTSGVDKTTSKQLTIQPSSTGIAIDAPLGYKLNLADFYIDSDIAGEGVNFIYLK